MLARCETKFAVFGKDCKFRPDGFKLEMSLLVSENIIFVRPGVGCRGLVVCGNAVIVSVWTVRWVPVALELLRLSFGSNELMPRRDVGLFSFFQATEIRAV